ncbi:MAG: pyridoxal-phosphate-dependent aminotransferase family protein [Thermomicrobiales bacterium]
MVSSQASHSPAPLGSDDPRLSHGRWLRIPGPTVLHPDVVSAMQGEMVAHRSPEAVQLIQRIAENLKAAHRTEQGVYVWAGTGSAGWEASIVNLLSPGDRIVVTVTGDFGDRYAKTAKTFGIDVYRLEVEWGQAVTCDMLEEAFVEHGPFKAAFITHNETSTGLTNPLPELAKVARAHDALVVVDAVSSAAALPLEVDEWDLDWVLSGAQKAWMCPPGLMVSAVSDRALAAAEKATFPRFFWDVRAMAAATAIRTTPTTPALSLLFGLDAALKVMLDEGMENVWARHARLGAHVREGLQAAGLKLLADPSYYSDSITAFYAPNGMTASGFHDRLRAESGIEIAIGQGHLANRILRVGHMGYVEQPELDAKLEAIARIAK